MNPTSVALAKYGYKFGKAVDLTRYSENELSLMVYNVEELYGKRHTFINKTNLRNWLASYMNFTESQWAVFLEDLETESM